jgi:cytochrome d ubiquinol oxidase subunit II
MELQALQIAWFVLYGVLLIGYAILDGFDLGVGALSLFAKDERERGLHMDAIAPVWDGNEVWLLAAGGSLFAAFPPVYATVFSGFYIAFFLLLAALIFRAVSFEFRNQVDSPRWRRAWDWAFGLGSLLPPILFGVAVGNVLRGLPIDARGEFTGTFLGLLNPYAIGVGVLVLAMFVTHGALYLAIKTEGDLHDRMIRWGGRAWIAWAALWVAMTLASFFQAPARFAPGHPLFWVFLAGAVGSLAVIPVLLGAGRLLAAFLASAGAILAQTAVALVGLFPVLVPSSLGKEFDLTAYASSSSAPTLTVMLVFAGLGMPVVIGYTAWIYRVFRGKVREGGGYH